MSDAERAAYERGLYEGANQTRETIATSVEGIARSWRAHAPSVTALTVAETLETLVQALRGHAFAPPAAPPAEDELEQRRRGA